MTRKKLIEVALPLEAINVASAREKSIRHGHPSTLHLWFARRPLAACRAVIFASLVDDPDSPDAPKEFVEACKRLDGKDFDYENKNVNATGDTPRMHLFDFIEKLVQWESTTDEKVIETARQLIRLSTDGNPPPLLDPFAGGGSIPLEAQRLGLKAHASDLNPVAVMINKAQIEIPPRFANRPPVNSENRAQKLDSSWKNATGLAADVRYYGAWMREKAFERIGHLYPKHNGETVIAWLWARTVISPNPAVNSYVPLVRSFSLSKKKGKEYWAKPVVEGNKVRFEVTKGVSTLDKEGTVTRTGAVCAVSGTPISFEYIRDEGKAGRIGVMLMAIVTDGQGGRNYYSPSEDHRKIAEVDIPEGTPRTTLPLKALGFRVQAYGMDEHYKLFTARQLVALTTFSDLVNDAREQIYRDGLAANLSDDKIPFREGGSGAMAYAEAVSVYLAFGVSRGADINNALCRWEISKTQVRNLFARQAIPMLWDFAENNVFNNAAGDYATSLESIVRVIERSLGQGIEGTALQADASGLNIDRASVLSTDPPYYDNIGYADLSDFFYIWLRKSLQNIFPEIFGTLLVPKELELIASPFRHGGREAANEHFERGLHQTFVTIHRFISMEYPLTVYYAFKQQEVENEEDAEEEDPVIASTGWETMLTSLIESGFSIDGTWPMRTELSNRMVGSGTNALASSIVLVCRPRPVNAGVISRREFVDLLRREMPLALKELQSGNIAPVDLAQASIGPGMAIYSRYNKVLEADGSPLSIRTALGLINTELDSYLAEQDGDTDVDTRFAVAWFEQYGFESGEFGIADVLARAKNTSVEGVARAGVIESARGRVRLLKYKELQPDWVPDEESHLTVWEAVHHLIERLNASGEAGAGELLALLPGDLGEIARTLTYRLYNICERKGWAELGFQYNALILSWTQVGQVASEVRVTTYREKQQRLPGDF